MQLYTDKSHGTTGLFLLSEVVNSSSSSPKLPSEMAVRTKRLQQSGDPISNLPEPIIGEILSLLPLKQAVCTSVLSKRWRRLWTHMSQLDLGFYKLNHNPTGWSKIVSSVLSTLRFSPIVSCHLAWPPFCQHNDIHRFLLMLSQSNIQKLTITSRSPTIVIPQCLLNCTTITDLSLSACAFPPSHPSFHCWSKLKSLALYRISMPRDDDHTIHSLLSSCNLLQSLTLWECNGVRYLKICCPKLTYLKVYSYSALSVCLEGTSGLLKAHITLRTKFRQEDNWEANDLLQILKLPASIETICLNLGQDLTKHWPKVHAFKYTFSCFLNLRKLDISINMKDHNAVSLFACLLRNSPLLKELHVQMEQFHKESTVEINFWDKHCYYPCLNQHLRIAKIYLDPFDEHNISFVKYLLAGTSSLTMMHIVLAKEENNEIFHLMKKASSHVDIKVENIRP